MHMSPEFTNVLCEISKPDYPELSKFELKSVWVFIRR